MRMKSTLSLIIVLGGLSRAAVAGELTSGRGGSLALPAAPANFATPEAREGYVRQLRTVLNTNTVTVQNQKTFDEQTLNRTLQQISKQKGSAADKTMVTLQEAWNSLQDVLSEAAPPEEFSSEEPPPPPTQSKMLVKQMIGFVTRQKIVPVTLPPTFIKWSEVFTAAEPRVRGALAGIHDVIAAIEADRDKMALEVDDMLVLTRTLEEQQQEYRARIKELEDRLADPNVDEEEKAFISNNPLFELKRDFSRIVGEQAFYVVQLGQRQQYLQLANPILIEVKTNAALAFPALQSAALIAACSYRLERVMDVNLEFRRASDAAAKGAAERLNRTAQKYLEHGQAQLMDATRFAEQDKRHQETQKLIESAENKGRDHVKAELEKLRQLADGVAAAGVTIETNLERIRQIETTRALPPSR